jgi:hypothetical protein
LRARSGRISWIETPRMKWRARGVRAYVGQLLRSLAKFAAFFAAFALLMSLSPSTAAHRAPLSTTAICVLMGLGLRLFMEAMPGTIGLTPNEIEYRSGSRRGDWPLRACNNLRYEHVNGLLRIQLDVLEEKGKRLHLIIAAPARLETSIRGVFQENLLPVAAAAGHAPTPPTAPLSDPPVLPLKYDEERPPRLPFRLMPSFHIGALMLFTSLPLFVLGVLLLWRNRRWQVTTEVFALSAALATSGVVLVRRASRG